MLIMDYQDRIYGDFQISDTVILELINSKTLQRLKNIDQAGYFEPHFPGTAHSRFEHSFGVYLLLKKYNAPIEEQIAGLIHDVSHSVFSHCIDYVLDAGSEEKHDHQDNVFDEFVRKSEIPAILVKFGFDLERILNDENFPLKEKKLPDLCADRIDYSLRTGVMFKVINQTEARELLENLVAEKGSWIFKNFEFAEKYAKLFMHFNSNYYAGLSSAVMFRTIGDYLRHALKKKYINESDLYSTDEKVLSKISQFHNQDEELARLFQRMNDGKNFINNPENYDAKVCCKSRVVDPLFKSESGIKRISEVDERWREIIKRELKPKCYFIKFGA